MNVVRTAVFSLSLLFAASASAQQEKKPDCGCPDIGKEVDMSAAAFGAGAFLSEFPDEAGVNTSVVSGDRNASFEGLRGKNRTAAANAVDRARADEGFTNAQGRLNARLPGSNPSGNR